MICSICKVDKESTLKSIKQVLKERDDLRDRVEQLEERIDRPKGIAERNQQALDVKYRMGQALIALETLGYEVRPNAGDVGG
jgi:cell division septum initiation protein DivIVA